MIIRNGNILNTKTQTFEARDLYIENGKIVDRLPENREILDAKGFFVIPGFIDTHIHGYFGCDFSAPGTDLTPGRLALARQGTTAFAATVSTRPMKQLCDAAVWLVDLMKKPSPGAKLCGIHSEGPFISQSRKGAMTPTGEACTPEAMERLIAAAAGNLKLMTIAPELENVPKIIAALKDRVTFSLGHTDASFEVAEAAVDAGATRSTHTFNGMRPLYHRETGILGAALTDDRIHCEMIGDFIHLDPPIVKLIYKAKGAENITLISDTGFMGGLPDGEYNGRIVKDGVCQTKTGTIAGSCFTILRGAQNLRKLGISLAEISVMASLNPAKVLGLEDSMGSIETGKQADLILCDEDLNIHAVLIDGQEVTL